MIISVQSITTRDKRNRVIAANIRGVFEDQREDWAKDTPDAAVKERQRRFLSTIESSVTYLRSQRTYKVRVYVNNTQKIMKLILVLYDRNYLTDTTHYTIWHKTNA